MVVHFELSLDRYWEGRSGFGYKAGQMSWEVAWLVEMWLYVYARTACV